MEARGRVLMAGRVALVALLVFCVPGCGNKAAEARYQKLNALRINLYDVALLIHSFQAESGRVFTDFSENGYGGLFAGGVRGKQLGEMRDTSHISERCQGATRPLAASGQ